MPVVGLNDLNAAKDDDDDNRNELYTGGNRRGGGGSGMAVLGPDEESEESMKSQVGSIFEQAKINAASADGPVGVDGAPKRVITMYANGFTVDDGPFRSLDDQTNQSFIRAVGRGEIPAELEERTGADGTFNIELVDRRGEAYTAPAYVAFGGGGQSLGSSETLTAAAVLGAPEESAAGSSDDGGKISNDPPVVDGSLPKTTVQIRLANGKRMRATLNLNHTVRHVEALVRSEGAGGQPYILLAGFPPAPPSDPDLTIEAAGLQGASITQKLA